MTLLSKLFTKLRPSTASAGSRAAVEAMKVSTELLQRMRKHSASDDPARALMSDIWSQRHNVPFMTTMYESAQEMNSPLRQGDTSNDKPS